MPDHILFGKRSSGVVAEADVNREQPVGERRGQNPVRIHPKSSALKAADRQVGCIGMAHVIAHGEYNPLQVDVFQRPRRFRGELRWYHGKNLSVLMFLT